MVSRSHGTPAHDTPRLAAIRHRIQGKRAVVRDEGVSLYRRTVMRPIALFAALLAALSLVACDEGTQHAQH